MEGEGLTTYFFSLSLSPLSLASLSLPNPNAILQVKDEMEAIKTKH